LKTIPETVREMNLRIKQMKRDGMELGMERSEIGRTIYLVGKTHALQELRAFIYRKSRAKK
jgi:hypothetical protein